MVKTVKPTVRPTINKWIERNTKPPKPDTSIFGDNYFQGPPVYQDFNLNPTTDYDTNPFASPHPISPRQEPLSGLEQLPQNFAGWNQQEYEDTKTKDKWVWRNPLPFPPFPTEPSWEPDSPPTPYPPYDKPVDDPFHPADEGPEAEDEGEDVDDPPRDRFDQNPLDCQQLEMIGIPCTGSASLQIQTAKPSKNELGKNQANYQSRLRNSSRKKSTTVQRSHTRRNLSRLRQSSTDWLGSVPRVQRRRSYLGWY